MPLYHQAAHTVPAAPFQKILHQAWEEEKKKGEHRVEEQNGVFVDVGIKQFLADRLGVHERRITYYLNNKYIQFDVADNIVSKMLGPDAWYSDPELNDIYTNFDLERLDWAYPVSEEVLERELRILKQWHILNDVEITAKGIMSIIGVGGTLGVRYRDWMLNDAA
jgi:hypothetical protein